MSPMIRCRVVRTQVGLGKKGLQGHTGTKTRRHYDLYLDSRIYSVDRRADGLLLGGNSTLTQVEDSDRQPWKVTDWNILACDLQAN